MLSSVPTLLSAVVTQGQGASAHSISRWPGEFFKVSWLGFVAAVVLTGAPACPMPCCLQQNRTRFSSITIACSLQARGGQLSSPLQAGLHVLVFLECLVVGGCCCFWAQQLSMMGHVLSE